MAPRPPDTAPFREYAHTDETIYQEGLESGANWQPDWDHLPGGPWVPSPDPSAHPDWKAHAALRKHHNKIWLQGWRAGVKTIRPVRRDIMKLLDKEVINKLSV